MLKRAVVEYVTVFLNYCCTVVELLFCSTVVECIVALLSNTIFLNSAFAAPTELLYTLVLLCCC